MGAWLLSILLMGIFSVVCGFTVYGITWLAKKRDKDLGEMSGGLSGFAIAILSVVFIFFSMLNSCTSKYTTYEESITDSLPAYFIIVGIIILGFVAYFFINNTRQLKKKDEADAQFFKQHGTTREEYKAKVNEEKNANIKKNRKDEHCF